MHYGKGISSQCQAGFSVKQAKSDLARGTWDRSGRAILVRVNKHSNSEPIWKVVSRTAATLRGLIPIKPMAICHAEPCAEKGSIGAAL